MTDGDALTRAEEAELARRQRPPQGGGDRVVSPLADSDERAIEGALRPKRLEDFVGQARVREQLTLLRGAGCQLAQGFLFSRPVPLSELTFKRSGSPRGAQAA